MSSTAYVHVGTLTRGHSATINSVSFSPDGIYLASGSDDHTVIIWKVSTGAFLYRMQFDSPVDSILWHPVHSETLIVGCESGTLMQLRGFTLVCDFLSRSQLVPSPAFRQLGCKSSQINLGVRGVIHALAYSLTTRCLAIAMENEVHVTCERDLRKFYKLQLQCRCQVEGLPDRYSGDIKIPDPAGDHEVDMDGQERRSYAVSIQFKESGSCLIVAYMSHGIMCVAISDRRFEQLDLDMLQLLEYTVSNAIVEN